MIKKNEIIVIFLMSLLTCCSSRMDNQYDNKRISTPQNKVNIDLNRVVKANPIKPDSSTQWLDVEIGTSYRIDFLEDYLFVLNNSNKQKDFHIYDIRLNKSLFSIQDKRLYDFSVDKTNRLVSLLIGNRNIRVLNFEGESISKYKLSESVAEIRNLSNNKLIGYNNFINNGTANYYFFEVETGNKVMGHLPIDKRADGLEWSVSTSLSRRNDTTIYGTTFFSNFIYKIVNNSVTKWLELDFGQNNPDFNQLLNQRKETSPFKLALRNNWVYTIDRIIESEDNLVCVIIKDGRLIQITLDKKKPSNWHISPDMGYVTSTGTTFVSILKDNESTTIENGVVSTKKIKLQFFNPPKIFSIAN